MNLRIIKDTVTPELKRVLGAAQRPRSVVQAGGKAMQVEISAHLRRLQARGNRNGWPAQKFFTGPSGSVEKSVRISKITDTGAELTIADPRFAHLVNGGTVSARRAKHLAIPLTAEAYAAAGKGSIQSAVPGLKLVVLKSGLFLCRETKSGGKNSRPQITPIFKLVKSITHKPHPDELPNPEALRNAAHEAMAEATRRLVGVGSRGDV